MGTSPSGAIGPKVLRIGLIQNGKIIEERIIRRRETVTVGQSEKCTFSLPVSEIPGRFELFELVTKDGQYVLNFFDTMSGRVSLGTGQVLELQEMRAQGVAKARNKAWSVPLTEQARGKIVIGESTMLFQFVTPPPVQPKPQLPAAVRGGLFRHFDWRLSITFSLSALLQIGFVVYAINGDYPVESAWDKYLKLEAMINPEVATLEKKKPKVEDAEGEGEKEKEDGEGEEKKTAKNSSKKRDQAEDQRSAADVARERAEKRAALAEALAQRGINKILGSMSADGSGAIADVLRGGDVGADQDDLLSQVRGVEVATGDIGGSLRGPVGGKDSGEAADVSQINVKGGDADVRTGGPGEERAVKVSMKTRDATAVEGEGVLDDDAVKKELNRRKPAIQGCYEKALRRDPSLKGKVTIRFTVAGTGRVSSAKTTVNEVSPEVGDCICNAFKSFRFPPPEGGSVTMDAPYSFLPQG